MEIEQEELLNILENYINNLNIDFKEFNLIIKEYKILLSGSFLLQIISKKKFDRYDIDLFILGKENLVLEDKLNELFSKDLEKYDCKNKVSKMTEKQYIELVEKNSHKYSINPSIDYELVGIDNVVNFIFKLNADGLQKVQLIYIDDTRYNNLFDNIDNFDFDICMNYFDGENIIIKNPQAIEDKTATLFANNDKYILTKRQYDRSLKYSLRNYNIKINFTKFNCVYEFLIIKTKNDLLLLNSAQSKNLMIFLTETLLIEKIESFPNQIENLIIIDPNELCVLNNLPLNLKCLRIYSDEQLKYGSKLQKNYYKYKIPFGCEFLINDKLM